MVGWSTTSQSGTNPQGGQVLTSDAIWSDGSDHGVSRNYGNNGPDGQFVQFPIGVFNYANFRANVACDVGAYDPASSETPVAVASLEAGQVLRLEGDGEANRGYILKGRTR